MRPRRLPVDIALVFAAALLLGSTALASLACGLVRPAVAALDERRFRLTYPACEHFVDPVTNQWTPLPPVPTRLEVAEKFAGCACAFVLSFLGFFAAVSALSLHRS